MNPALGGALAGLLGGMLSGAFGVGGGLVLVPLLALLLGLTQHQAQGVTLAVMLLPLGLPAVVAYARQVTIRWRLVAALVAGFLGGVGLGALLAAVTPERPLRAIFLGFMLFSAVRAWRAAPRRDGEPLHCEGACAWHGLWIGALGGALSGLLGLGGGLVMVPLLVAVVGLGQREAQATSLATMLPPVGLPGVLVYARAHGGFDWALLAALAVAFGAGGFLGARAAVRARPRVLTRAFALYVLTAAAALAWRMATG